MQQTLFLILGSTGGALVAFLLQKYGATAVVAASVVGLLGALIGHLASLPNLPTAIFAGAFVGMTSLSIGSLPMIAIAGAFAGFFYSISLSVFPGFGGRLGAVALVSVLLSFYVFMFLKKGG